MATEAAEPNGEVWILTMGTRGDLQPFFVLALGIRRAGISVRLFGPPELGAFCRSVDLPFKRACRGWKEHTADAALQEPDEVAASPDNLAFGREARASSEKAVDKLAGCAVDGKPNTRWTSKYADEQWLSVDLGEVRELSYIEIKWEKAYAKTYSLQGSLDGKRWALLAEEKGQEGWVVTRLPKGSRARHVRMYGHARATNFGFSIWDLRVYAPGTKTSRPSVRDPNFLKVLEGSGVDVNNAGDVGHMLWLWDEMPSAIATIQKAMEAGRPDLLIYNHLMVNIGVLLWKRYGVRTLFANLGLEFHFAPNAIDSFNHKTLSAFDRSIVEPMLGMAPVAQMSHEEFTALYTSPDRLLGTTRLIKEILPVADQEVYENWNFTGFWILDEEQQRQIEDPDAFGGPGVVTRLQDFIRRGSKPVYMGWGSMPFTPRLLVVAVGALKALRLRAVIAKGWSHADLGMFYWIEFNHKESGVGVSTEQVRRLRQYAEANVLFVDQAPHEWLFKQCACTVHHGGAGTTAAAVRAGVPTIVVPVAYDQPYHGDWVSHLGVGIKTSHFAWVDVHEMEAALRRATSDGDMKARARAVAKTLCTEPGVSAAVEQIRRTIRDDVHSGAARARWEAEQAEHQGVVSDGGSAEDWLLLPSSTSNA